MAPKFLIVNVHETLQDHYHQIMDYIDAKYDHHSVIPTYLPPDKVAEMQYYETQASMLVRDSDQARHVRRR